MAMRQQQFGKIHAALNNNNNNNNISDASHPTVYRVQMLKEEQLKQNWKRASYAFDKPNSQPQPQKNGRVLAPAKKSETLKKDLECNERDLFNYADVCSTAVTLGM